MPLDEDSFTPDLIVNDVAYVRTGVLNSDGSMVLRRVSKPIGFTANFWSPPKDDYLVEPG